MKITARSKGVGLFSGNVEYVYWLALSRFGVSPSLSLKGGDQPWYLQTTMKYHLAEWNNPMKFKKEKDKGKRLAELIMFSLQDEVDSDIDIGVDKEPSESEGDENYTPSFSLEQEGKDKHEENSPWLQIPHCFVLWLQ